MRDVLIATLIYSLLFIVLTTTVPYGIGTMSDYSMDRLHYLASEVIFWVATFYICASATYGAFARQDRFSLSQNHPVINRLLSVLLIASPFLAVFVNVRFVFVMLGLLVFSHLRSKTDEEKNIEFVKSRALSNLLLLPLFTLALMLMNVNGYYVTSILSFGSTAMMPMPAEEIIE
jgi:hypothetical protein